MYLQHPFFSQKIQAGQSKFITVLGKQLMNWQQPAIISLKVKGLRHATTKEPYWKIAYVLAAIFNPFLQLQIGRDKI